jgi:hypothetical protein
MPAADGLASWYTPGLVDGFGDRLLMFDNTETDSLELLRFYPSLTAVQGFEDALHDRVRLIGRIPDHAFPLIVAVERLDGDGALALVSTHTPGKRLSAFFDRPGPRRGLNPAFVTGIVTNVVHALAVLQSKGEDIAHSAITADRVVVSTGGRIVVVEHVLGLALERLKLSSLQLWREFGLVSAPTESGDVALGPRTDVYQLGVLALEMLIGRRLTPLDLKDRVPDLLEQWSEAATRAGLTSERLRVWLERALQLGDRPYAHAAEAAADLRDMPAEPAASPFESLPTAHADAIGKRALQPATLAAPQESPMANAPAHDAFPSAASSSALRPALVPSEGRWPDAFEPEEKPSPAALRFREAMQEEAVAAPVPPPPAPKVSAPAFHAASTLAPKPTTFRTPRVSPWIAAALGVVALVEGGVIAALLMRQPAANTVSAAAAPVASPIPALETAPPPAAPPAAAAAVDTGSSAPAPPPPAPQGPDVARLAAAQRSGGIRLVTPIELKVLEGDRVLGSTADGPIIHTAGLHQLDLINTTLGFRTRVPVTFRAGQIASVNVTIPPGRLSVNALPWAEVLIDNRAVGETPLANLSVPVGEHEITFRHPELGERRQTITVRADAPARVSTAFDK